MQSYIIRKAPDLYHEHKEIAKMQIDDEGKLSYQMLAQDSDVEKVLLEAQQNGGLSLNIPFCQEREVGDGTIAVVEGQKREFIKTTDFDNITDAIQYALKGGIVDRE